MASAMILSFLFTIHLIVILSSTSLTSSSTTKVFSKPIEKITQLHFYFHDSVVAGKNQTSMLIIAPPKGSVGYFGATNIMDNPLTEGPSLSSKLIGRSQGIYAVASLDSKFNLLMATNFVFTEGEYNGSTIAILGRNPVWMKVREMPVVGGTGVFRYARGFAVAKTYSFNAGIAIVEYHVSVLHH